MGKGKKEKNPADAFRKELRKKELAKLKKERTVVREVRDMLNDPTKIDEEIQKAQKISDENRLDKSLKDRVRELERMKEVSLTKQKVMEASGQKAKMDARAAAQATQQQTMNARSQIGGLGPKARGGDRAGIWDDADTNDVQRSSFPRGPPRPPAHGMPPPPPQPAMHPYLPIMTGSAHAPRPPPPPLPPPLPPHMTQPAVVNGRNVNPGNAAGEPVARVLVPPPPPPPPRPPVGPAPHLQHHQQQHLYMQQMQIQQQQLYLLQQQQQQQQYQLQMQQWQQNQTKYMQKKGHQNRPNGRDGGGRGGRGNDRNASAAARGVDPLDPEAEGYTERFGSNTGTAVASDTLNDSGNGEVTNGLQVEEETLRDTEVVVVEAVATEVDSRMALQPDLASQGPHSESEDTPVGAAVPTGKVTAGEEEEVANEEVEEDVLSMEGPQLPPTASSSLMPSAEELMRRRFMVPSEPEGENVYGSDGGAVTANRNREEAEEEEEEQEDYPVPQAYADYAAAMPSAEELMRRRFMVPSEPEEEEENGEDSKNAPTASLAQQYETHCDSYALPVGEYQQQQQQQLVRAEAEQEGSDVEDVEDVPYSEHHPPVDKDKYNIEDGKDEGAAAMFDLNNLIPAKLPASFTKLPDRDYDYTRKTLPYKGNTSITQQGEDGDDDDDDDDDDDNHNGDVRGGGKKRNVSHMKSNNHPKQQQLQQGIYGPASAGNQSSYPSSGSAASATMGSARILGHDGAAVAASISKALVASGPKIVKTDRALTAFVPSALKQKRQQQRQQQQQQPQVPRIAGMKRSAPTTATGTTTSSSSSGTIDTKSNSSTTVTTSTGQKEAIVDKDSGDNKTKQARLGEKGMDQTELAAGQHLMSIAAPTSTAVGVQAQARGTTSTGAETEPTLQIEDSASSSSTSASSNITNNISTTTTSAASSHTAGNAAALNDFHKKTAQLLRMATTTTTSSFTKNTAVGDSFPAAKNSISKPAAAAAAAATATPSSEASNADPFAQFFQEINELEGTASGRE